MMSIERVRAYFRARNLEDRVQEFDVSSATVELAAQALHVEDRVALVVAAGDAKIANPKFKAQFHTKAKMLSHDEAESLIGHAVGGVCPFAVNDGVDVYLDESLRRFETVFPAAGSASSAIELTIPELEANCDHFKGWVDVCKLPEG